MKTNFKLIAVLLVLSVLCLALPAQAKSDISENTVQAGGIKMHYLSAGQGPVIVLLHGFGETSRMWIPLMKALEKNHTVIAPDLRGAGGTDTPEMGYEKTTMARDVYNLLQALGYQKISIVGHDIGMMVAFAYAEMFQADCQKVVLMDAFLPGIGDWKKVWSNHDLWHFNFYGPTPEALVKGRERIYLDHFWNDFAADPKKSIPEADRDFYTKSYAKPGYMHAAMNWFASFDKDAEDFADLKDRGMVTPMLVLSAEKSGGQMFIDQAKMTDPNVQGVIVPGAGHWLMEEAPDVVIPQIVQFLN